MPSIHTTKRKGNICLYRIHAWMITEVLFVITPNWEKKVSINKWINKHIVVYPNLKILLSNRNEWTTDTFNNVDEPQNSYLNERSRPPAKKKTKKHKTVHTGWIHTKMKTKLWWQETDYWSWAGMGVWTAGEGREGDEETFKGGKYVHNLFNMMLSYVCVCENLLNSKIWVYTVYLC